MRMDTKFKERPVLAVNLGDAIDMLTHSPEVINRALEKDPTLGAPLKEKVIRPFNKVEREKIINGDKNTTRKRVVVIYLSSLPNELANAIIRGNIM